MLLHDTRLRTVLCEDCAARCCGRFCVRMLLRDTLLLAAWNAKKTAETRDLQIFSLTLPQLSYRGSVKLVLEHSVKHFLRDFFLGRDFSSGIAFVEILLQNMFGKIFLQTLFGRGFFPSLFWKGLLFKVCLVESFASHLFW